MVNTEASKPSAQDELNNTTAIGLPTTEASKSDLFDESSNETNDSSQDSTVSSLELPAPLADLTKRDPPFPSSAVAGLTKEDLPLGNPVDLSSSPPDICGAKMDRREILSKGSALQKAIAAKEPTAVIIGILQDLKVHVKPNEELLRATGIGKVVNKVKGISGVDPSVQQLASEIISRWRHVVNEQKLASPGSSTPNGARSNGTSSPAPQIKPVPKAASPGVDPSKRNWKTDKVPRDELTSDTARNNCIGLMYDGLCLNSTRPTSEILDVAKAIESAALALPDAKKSPATPAYREKMRSLFQNLKNKSNPTLRTRILSGAITPENFVSMSHEEMKSQEQRDEDKRLEKENMHNAMRPEQEKSISSSIECPKCHKKTVSYSQAQTRSADEPMTNFCECQSCGNRWKFS